MVTLATLILACPTPTLAQKTSSKARTELRTCALAKNCPKAYKFIKRTVQIDFPKIAGIAWQFSQVVYFLLLVW